VLLIEWRIFKFLGSQHIDKKICQLLNYSHNRELWNKQNNLDILLNFLYDVITYCNIDEVDSLPTDHQ